jgi:hypothetical protein
MLNCLLNSLENFVGNGTEVSVLDRQRARLEWIDKLQQPQQLYVTNVSNNSLESHVTPRHRSLISDNLLLGEHRDDPSAKAELHLGDGSFPGIANLAVGGKELGFVSPACRSSALTFHQEQSLLTTCSRLPVAVEAAKMNEKVAVAVAEEMEVVIDKDRLNKRKAEVCFSVSLNLCFFHSLYSKILKITASYKGLLLLRINAFDFWCSVCCSRGM